MGLLSLTRVSFLFQTNLLQFIGFYWVLLGFTGFYWVFKENTGFYWIFPFSSDSFCVTVETGKVVVLGFNRVTRPIKILISFWGRGLLFFFSCGQVWQVRSISNSGSMDQLQSIAGGGGGGGGFGGVGGIGGVGGVGGGVGGRDPNPGRSLKHQQQSKSVSHLAPHHHVRPICRDSFYRVLLCFFSIKKYVRCFSRF